MALRVEHRVEVRMELMVKLREELEVELRVELKVELTAVLSEPFVCSPRPRGPSLAECVVLGTARSHCIARYL